MLPFRTRSYEWNVSEREYINFVRVTEVAYLGFLLNTNNSVSQEIETKIGNEINLFYKQNSFVFQNSK